MCNLITYSRRVTAFTLIELLVVISIVALLISILLPALGKARKSSRSIVCATIEKQIGTWAMTYAVENKGILPTHGDTNWSDTWGTLTSTTWYDKSVPAGLYNGWGKDSALKCPEAKIQIAPLREPNRNITYGINQYMGGIRRFGSHGEAPLPRMEILTSRGYWFGETRAVYYSSQQYWDYHPVLQMSNSATPSTSWPWCWPNTVVIDSTGHPDLAASFLFGDGHVSLVKKETFQDMNSTERTEFVARFY